MLDEVRRYIEQEALVSPGDGILVAVSGGPDSVALLHILHRLASQWNLRLHVFHLDHGLRGEASAVDARYTAALAAELGLQATVVRLQPGELKALPGSLQANARERRYQELARVARQLGFTKVATGHNRDDQAETVLMRFLRGSATRGLAGIPPCRQEGDLLIIRPLLNVPRSDIERYCGECKLFPRLDESNTKGDYLRNRVRLELLPLLANEYNPAIGADLAATAAIMREEEALLNRLAHEALARCQVAGEGVRLSGAALRREPLALARRTVRLAGRLAGGEGELGLPAVTQVLEAANRCDGSHRIDLPGHLTLTAEYGVLRFELGGGAAPRPEVEPTPIALSGETRLEGFGLLITADWPPPGEATETGDGVAEFDADRLPAPLAVRLRRPGDRIWPVGMEGSKKLQDILVDAKVPRCRRETLPLLVAGSDVVWVIGHRLDRRYLATPLTGRRLRITARPLERQP